jgi:hypothetical protein
MADDTVTAAGPQAIHGMKVETLTVQPGQNSQDSKDSKASLKRMISYSTLKEVVKVSEELLKKVSSGGNPDEIWSGIEGIEELISAAVRRHSPSYFESRAWQMLLTSKEVWSAGYERTEWIFPGFPLGYVGCYLGAGEAGKTWAAQETAFSLALAGRFTPDEIERNCLLLDPLGLGITVPRKVLYISGEDNQNLLGKRMQWAVWFMAGYVAADDGSMTLPEGREDYVPRFLDILEKNFFLLPLQGMCFDLGDDDKMVETDAIARMVRDNGFGLVVFDTLVRFHTLRENENGEMAALLGKFERIARMGNASVLLVHHVSKDAAFHPDLKGDSVASARGAGCIGDNTRFSLNFTRMTKKEAEARDIAPWYGKKKYVKRSVSKQNHGEEEEGNRTCWLARQRHGFLKAVTLSEAKNDAPKAKKAQEATANDGTRHKTY